MQTFLPYSEFDLSAKVLHMKHLGKQRVETLQIMSALVRGTGWGNHSTTRMWRGYEAALMVYQEAICEHWMSFGYADSCLEKTRVIFMELPFQQRLPIVPEWLGLEAIHSIHRSNLLRKKPEHYEAFGWNEGPLWSYWYPPQGFSNEEGLEIDALSVSVAQKSVYGFREPFLKNG